jgi:Fe-Mn family superoxide dismutase
MTSAAKQSPPPASLDAKIQKAFGSFSEFQKKFEASAASHFGSGWVWLLQDPVSKTLSIKDTHDAINPLKDNMHPLLVLDVWEHAYYIDKRNNRLGYIQEWWKLVNWEFVASNLLPEA